MMAAPGLRPLESGARPRWDGPALSLQSIFRADFNSRPGVPPEARRKGSQTMRNGPSAPSDGIKSAVGVCCMAKISEIVE